MSGFQVRKCPECQCINAHQSGCRTWAAALVQARAALAAERDARLVEDYLREHDAFVISSALVLGWAERLGFEIVEGSLRSSPVLKTTGTASTY